jgi:glutamate dehydrogenase
MAASLAERQRLFALPRSSWQDYDKSNLSTGAMIISRNEKSVQLTPEAITAIGIGKATATPFEIMSAILRSEIDLLWFGGIGTYIKAALETDADVGDRANDAVRVTADEVQAKVIGEGANLGVTQKGRIAYTLAGGRCNSDAIDNSAGVNCSDVEVNIKIALASAMQAGRLSRDKRNQLLASMTEDVGKLVLRNNYLQTLAISLTARKGAGNAEELSRLMTVIEASGQLNRKVEMLPDDAAFVDRYANSKPLTRPEIGVLLSYAKIVLFDALVASDLPDDPHFDQLLTGYFPAKMQKTYASDIAGHRLHREIVATLLANEVINRGGPGFIQAMSDATGALGAEVVKAATLASEGFDLGRLWAETDALDATIPGETQNSLYAEITAIFSQTTRLLLQTGTSTGAMTEAASRLKAALKNLRSAIATTMPPELVADIASRRDDLVAAGIPVSLAGDVTMLSALVLTPEIIQVAEKTGDTLARAATSYFAVSQTFRIDRLMSAGGRISTSDHYDSLALTRSLDQIAAARRDIIVVALTSYPKDKNPAFAWHAADRIHINRIGAELTSLTESGELSLSKIAVAAGLLTDLARGPAR